MHKTAVEIDPLKYYNQSIWVKSKKVLIEDPYAEKYQKSFCAQDKLLDNKNKRNIPWIRFRI